MSATRLMLLVSVAAIATTACPNQREGLSRDALERSFATADGREAPPTTSSLLQLRVPPVPAMPKTLVGSPEAQAFARGDGVAGDATGVDAAVLRCLTADAWRDYPAIVAHCLDAVVAAPHDLRSAVLLGVLQRHLPSIDDAAREEVLRRTGPLVPACAASDGGSCAWLALVVDRLQRRTLEELGRSRPASDRSVGRVDVDGPLLDADQHFVGGARSGQPLRPHPHHSAFVVDAADGRLHPARHGGAGWYRLTAAVSVAATDALAAHVFVDGDGPFQASIAGTTVLSRPRDVAIAAVEHVAVQLRTGRPVVEVVAWDGGDGIALSLIDDRGAPLSVVSATSKTSVPRRRTASGDVTVDDGDRGFAALLLPPRIDDGDTDALVTTLLRAHAALAGFASPDERATLTTSLIGHHGWSAPALVVAAQGLEESGLPESFARALAAPLWARVNARWPTAPLPLLAAARVTAAEQPEQALEQLRALVVAAPAYPAARRELLPRLLELDLVDEAADVADGLLAATVSADVIDAVLPAYTAAGRHLDAARLIEERARRRREPWRRDLVAGDTAAAKAALAKLVDDPGTDDEQHRNARAAALRLLGPTATTEALALVDARLPHAGRAERERLLHTKARLLAVGSTDLSAAQATLASSSTSSIDGLLLAAALGVAPPWQAELDLGDRVVDARRSSAPPFAPYPMVFLLNHAQHAYADDGSALVTRHWIAEVRNKQAIDGIGELDKDDDELLVRLRVIKPDGSVVEPEHHADVEDISLTGLAPGDVIEWLSVRVDDTAVAGDGLLSRSLSSTVPVVDWLHEVSWPTALASRRRLELHRLHGAAAPDVRTVGARTINAFAQRDLAPMLPEPLAVDDDEELPTVIFAIDADDDTVRRLRWLSFVPAARSDPWLREAAIVIAGRGPEDERLRRIFRFVVERIDEADSPAEAVATLAVGQGRRLPLLLALLRAADLRVSPIALHPTLLEPVDAISLSTFATPALQIDIGDVSHVAAVVGGVALLDRLPSSFARAAVLDLDDGTRTTLPSSAIDPAVVEVQLDLRLTDVDGAATLQGLAALRLPAAIADGVRRAVRGATPEQLAQFVEAGFASSLPGLSAKNVTLPGLDGAGGPMAFVADVVVPATDDTVRFEHVFSQGAAAAFRAAAPLAAYVQVAERHRTLRVWPHDERVEIVLQLPSSAAFVEVPPTTTVTAGPVTLVQRSAVADGRLVWDRRLTMTPAKIAPAAWPATRAALAPLIATTDARIGFVTTTTTTTTTTAAATP